MLDGDADAPGDEAARRRVAAWDGRASPDSPGYGIVKRFHDGLAGRLTPALLAPVRARYPDADDLGESALWTLATEKPVAFLPDGAASWDALLHETARTAAADAAPTWGDENRADIHHPLADALPLVGRFLRMPDDPLAGDGRMPRVARPASARASAWPSRPASKTAASCTCPAATQAIPSRPTGVRATTRGWRAARCPSAPAGPAGRSFLTPAPPRG